MRRWTKVAVLLIILGAVVPMAAEPGNARRRLPLEDHECGDQITHSFRLNNDLDGCTGGGLVIFNVNNITIDLNGHYLEGNGVSTDAGISIEALPEKGKNLTIKNGAINQFHYGIVGDGQNLKIINVHIARSADAGILLTGNKGPTLVKNSSISFSGNEGIEMSEPNSRIINNTFSNNPVGVIVTVLANGSLISGNTIANSATNGMDITSHDVRINNNTVAGTGTNINGPEVGVGILFRGISSENSASRNFVTGSVWDGIRDIGLSNRLTKNVANGNGFNGVGDGSGKGIKADDADSPEGSGNSGISNDDDAGCTGGPPGYCV